MKCKQRNLRVQNYKKKTRKYGTAMNPNSTTIQIKVWMAIKSLNLTNCVKGSAMLETSTSRCDDPLRERGCPASTAPSRSLLLPSLVSVALNSATRGHSDADSKSAVLFMRDDLGNEWKKSNWKQIPTATKFLNIKIENQQGILNSQLREKYWVKFQKINIHQKDAYESNKPFKIDGITKENFCQKN